MIKSPIYCFKSYANRPNTFHLQCFQADRFRFHPENPWLSYSINDATAYAAVAKLKLFVSRPLSFCQQSLKLDLPRLFTQ